MRRSALGRTVRAIMVGAAIAATASCVLFETPPEEPEAPREAPDAPREEPEAPRDEPDQEPPQEAPPRDEPWERLAVGQQSAVRIPVARAIRDPKLWIDFWFAINANVLDPPEPPAVDFEDEVVVVLILGERRTGGYSVRIADVIERRHEVEVVVATTRPGADEFVTQALTSPYYVATLPFPDKEIVFAGDDVESGYEEY